MHAVGWPALAIVMALSLALPAQEAAAQTGPQAQAAALYHNYCSVCHGDKGNGKSRAAGSLSTMPRDFTSEASRGELSRERIALAITHGRPGTAMVAWKSQLSETDISRLTDYVYTTFVQGSSPALAGPISGTKAHGGREADTTASASTRADMTVALPNGLKGDARRGSAFYLANCATCHGTRGDGAGPRAYFINPKPRNFIEEASRARLNRLALYVSVSEGRLGTEMPSWNKVATPQQIADVAEYVFQTFIDPKATPAVAAQGGKGR